MPDVAVAIPVGAPEPAAPVSERSGVAVAMRSYGWIVYSYVLHRSVWVWGAVVTGFLALISAAFPPSPLDVSPPLPDLLVISGVLMSIACGVVVCLLTGHFLEQVNGPLGDVTPHLRARALNVS